jgi:general secretion pathway protein C
MSKVSSIIEEKLAVILPRIAAKLKSFSNEGLQRLESRMILVIVPVAAGYLCASVMGGFMGQSMVDSIIASKIRLTMAKAESSGFSIGSLTPTNTRDLQKAVKDRNIFNSEGKFPEEKSGAGAAVASGAQFDIDAPCAVTALPIELLGTIYLGDRLKSLATVRDKSYSEADIYRVGDVIYGNENATVAAVERQKIILNNNGVKECIDLDKSKEVLADDGFPVLPGEGFGGSASGAGTEVVVEAAYVEGELGAGFGKIVDSARLVPNQNEGAGINGFKIFAIKGGTLFARIGLQNGDVITRVNDVSMTQAEEGFAMYKAFEGEKEVRIQLLRGGTTPQNITVRIK